MKGNLPSFNRLTEVPVELNKGLYRWRRVFILLIHYLKFYHVLSIGITV